MQMDMDKGRTNWTAEEDAVLLAHLRANECSYRDFSGKHIFTVTQGRGGGGVQHLQCGGGKQDVRQDACAESDTY
jgi:hypothetical protein